MTTRAPAVSRAKVRWSAARHQERLVAPNALRSTSLADQLRTPAPPPSPSPNLPEDALSASRGERAGRESGPLESAPGCGASNTATPSQVRERAIPVGAALAHPGRALAARVESCTHDSTSPDMGETGLCPVHQALHALPASGEAAPAGALSGSAAPLIGGGRVPREPGGVSPPVSVSSPIHAERELPRGLDSGAASGGISIDWLSVYQNHSEAPLLGETLLLFCDLDSGEIKSQAVRGLQHRGSHDSSLQIRCDGRRVEVSGNPSKWGRFDNLYGYSSIAACLEVYNSVLRQLGLPEFTEEERVHVAPFQFQRSDSVAASGAVITRVDLCRNWSAGDAGSARSVLAALSSVVRNGKCAWLSPDGNTAAWGVGSRYVYTKYYLKGPELRKHPGSDPAYSAALAGWCDTVGLVRQEVSLKAMQLKRNGLDRPGAWSYDTMLELVEQYSPHKDAGTGRCDFQDLQSTLQASGVPASRARAAQTALYAYLAGHQFVWEGPKANISRSAFYRLRSDLRVAGVDIAAPLNVSTLPVRVREVALSPAAAPEWYRWAG